MTIHIEPFDHAPIASPLAWWDALPVLRNGVVTLRELERDDAPALFRHVCKPSVLAHVAPAPTTVEGLERFIEWTHADRRLASHACFGIVPAGHLRPIGFIQLWSIASDFATGEWGCLFDDDFWGRGLFRASASLALEFGFNTIGIRRLEARVAVTNTHANEAILKLGASREGLLRRCFSCGDGTPTDHIMWSILAEEWRAAASRLDLPRPRDLVHTMAVSEACCGAHTGQQVSLIDRPGDRM